MKSIGWKKPVAALLCLLFCCAAFAAAEGVGEKTLGDFTFSLPYGSYAALTDYRGVGGSVAVPAEVDGVPVTGIASSAFDGAREQITDLTLPGSLERISSAFMGCTGLTNVTLMDGMTAVGANAFNGCASLTDILLPGTLRYIGPGAFAGTGLAEISVPEGVTEIGVGAFDGCEALTSVSLPATLTKAVGNDFSALPSLTAVFFGGTQAQWSLLAGQLTLPASVTVYVGGIPETPEAAARAEDTAWETAEPEKIPETAQLPAAEPEPAPIFPQSVAAHEHRWVDSVNTATCVASGRATSTCSVCGETATRTTPPRGHELNYAFNNNGTLKLTCARCGEEFSGDKLTGIEWEADPERAANICANRGYHLTRLVERTATCTKGGLTERIVCTACGIDLIPAREMGPRGHWWGKWTELEPGTCITRSKETRKCRNCSATEKRDGDYNFNRHVNTYLIGTVKPTCVTPGYTGDWYCRTCCRLAQRGWSLPVSTRYEDHPKESIEIRNRVAPTCTMAGCSGDEYCKACRKIIKYGVPLAPGPHENDGTGKCKYCGIPM